MCNWNLCLTFQKGLEAANLEGLETAEVLEATAGLEVEANLEVLESVGLEAVGGPTWRAWRRWWGPTWRSRRWRPPFIQQG